MGIIFEIFSFVVGEDEDPDAERIPYALGWAILAGFSFVMWLLIEIVI